MYTFCVENTRKMYICSSKPIKGSDTQKERKHIKMNRNSFRKKALLESEMKIHLRTLYNNITCELSPQSSETLFDTQRTGNKEPFIVSEPLGHSNDSEMRGPQGQPCNLIIGPPQTVIDTLLRA